MPCDVTGARALREGGPVHWTLLRGPVGVDEPSGVMGALAPRDREAVGEALSLTAEVAQACA